MGAGEVMVGGRRLLVSICVVAAFFFPDTPEALFRVVTSTGGFRSHSPVQILSWDVEGLGFLVSPRVAKTASCFRGYWLAPGRAEKGEPGHPVGGQLAACRSGRDAESHCTLGFANSTGRQFFFSFKNILFRDFPGGPVAKALCFQCRECWFNPWSGNEDFVYLTVLPKDKK